MSTDVYKTINRLKTIISISFMSIIRRKSSTKQRPLFDCSSLKKRESDRRISCQDLGKGDCEGRLWIRKSNLFKSKYVYRWCVLKNFCLYFYVHTEAQKAEGIIYLRDYRVTPIEDFKLKCFSFKIFNNTWTFTFAAESQTSFTKWLSKLQLSASGIQLDDEECPVSGFQSPFIRSNSSTLKSEFTIVNDSDIETEDGFKNADWKTYSESEDSDYEEDSEGTSSTGSDRCKSKLFAAESEEIRRTSAELEDITMKAITRLLEIERILQEKRELFKVIDEFTKLTTTSDNIRQFWNEYQDLIVNSEASSE